MPGRIAGETARRRRPARLRADPADARAAHPPRESDLEHLHGAGAQRARRRRLPLLARPARDRRAGRADGSHGPTTRARRSRRSAGVEQAARPAGRARVRAAPRRRRRRRARALHRRGRQPGRRPAGADRSRGGPRRPAGRDHRAPLARGHRPPRGGARRGRRRERPGSSATRRRCRREPDRREPPARRSRDRGAPRAHDTTSRPAVARAATPLQREHARTIFQKGAPGRRAFVCPELDVPAAARRGAARALPPRRAAPAAGDLRAGDRPPLRRHLQAQLRPRLGLLPARLLHDEAQPAPA